MTYCRRVLPVSFAGIVKVPSKVLEIIEIQPYDGTLFLRTSCTLCPQSKYLYDETSFQ